MKRLIRLLKSFWKREQVGSCGKKFRCGKNMVIHNGKNISIGDNFLCADNCELSVWSERVKNMKTPEISIGNNVAIASYSYISCANKITISDGVLLGVNTFITDNFHGDSSIAEKFVIPNNRKLYSKGEVIIGRNVWIGRNVCIMPGVTIGDYSVVGANAVVTHDIPSNSIAVGVPAKVISKLK